MGEPTRKWLAQQVLEGPGRQETQRSPPVHRHLRGPGGGARARRRCLWWSSGQPARLKQGSGGSQPWAWNRRPSTTTAPARGQRCCRRTREDSTSTRTARGQHWHEASTSTRTALARGQP
eukprot:2921350-Pyramimonas_sp.AAC.1